MNDDQKPPLTFDDVQEILRVLEKSAFEELRLEIGNLRLRLRRGGGQPSPAAPWEEIDHVVETASPKTATTRPPDAATSPAGLIDIRAPMLGTFYRAPRPGAPPFVDIERSSKRRPRLASSKS